MFRIGSETAGPITMKLSGNLRIDLASNPVKFGDDRSTPIFELANTAFIKKKYDDCRTFLRVTSLIYVQIPPTRWTDDIQRGEPLDTSGIKPWNSELPSKDLCPAVVGLLSVDMIRMSPFLIIKNSAVINHGSETCSLTMGLIRRPRVNQWAMERAMLGVSLRRDPENLRRTKVTSARALTAQSVA
ncbi:jg9790 [Pararge aegeria aegeria]|uniref:Jg9790 protein n=1 Tax=Pararge aegeria aegeria TaxID=348720 RepID=A0A8S4RL31_9NEOP|nr:jg9790 [Pararge aegeria aegeria]